MKKMYKSKLFKILRIRRRSVVRTIDFLVSFTLFIILLTQFYLIIINMNLNLASTSTRQNNPAELYSDKILSSPGSTNWGQSSGLPQEFGLASNYQYSNLGYHLDLAKLAHLNSELQNLSIGSLYSYINPQQVVNNITGSNNNIQFRISTRAPIQVIANRIDPSNSLTSTLSISTSNWGNASLANVGIDIHYISLTDGKSPYNITSETNQFGKLSVATSIGTDNYVAVIYAHSLASWGLTWVQIQNNGTRAIDPSSISSFLLNNPIKNKNSVLQYTTNTTVVSDLRSTTCYTNSTSNLVINNTIATNSSGLINQEINGVGSDGPLIQIYTMSNSTTDFYRIVSLPLVFDNNIYASPSTANFKSNQFSFYETSNFSNVDLTTIYSYTTMVLTNRGSILFTLDLSTG